MLDTDARHHLRDHSTAPAESAPLTPPTLDDVLPNGNPLEATLRELITAAKRAIETVRGGSRVSPKVQAQARAVVDELGQALRDAGSRPPASIRVAEDGTWFEVEGQHVDVARRGAVRRLLAGLANARQSSSGRALSVDELFQIGWPGERIPYESQVRRVYTAIWTLRTLGLEGTLLTRDEGYLLESEARSTPSPVDPRAGAAFFTFEWRPPGVGAAFFTFERPIPSGFAAFFTFERRIPTACLGRATGGGEGIRRKAPSAKSWARRARGPSPPTWRAKARHRRRRRDSNPWYPSEYASFQNWCLRPLGHSSGKTAVDLRGFRSACSTSVIRTRS